MDKRLIGLIKREFFSYVNSPLAYVVVATFLLLNSFLFFRTALVLGDANLRPFIEILPWFLVVIAPALTMRAFSDEQRKGTLELLLAHPLSEGKIVLGKFLGAVLFYLVLLAATLGLPLTLGLFSNPDWGVILSQYLAAAFIGSTFLAIGLVTSAYVKQVVGSFLLGAALSFLLLLIGLQFVVLMVPAPFNLIINQLALVNHLTNLSRGVLDLRDILYFLTIIGVSLTAAVIKISERKFVDIPAEKRKLALIMALVVAVGIGANLVLYTQPIRIDTTSDRRYSLSQGTKQLLSELPDQVTITLYSSANLPGPMQVALRETSDRLVDFKRYAGDKLVVQNQVVTTPEEQQDAAAKGIRMVNFNQLGGNSIQIQQGNLGLEVRYGDSTEVIDFIDDASQLEYQLSRMMLTLTRDGKPKLGYMDLTTDADLSILNQLLGEQYELSLISDTNEEEVDWEGLLGVVVLDDGSQTNATASAMLKNYLNNNGNAALFVEGVGVDQQLLSANTSESDIITLLKDHGLTINADLVYDLQLNQPVTLSDESGRQYIVPYPFWFNGLVNREAVPWGGVVNNVMMGWSSSITIAADKQEVFKPIIQTGLYAGSQQNSFTIAPQEAAALQEVTGEAYTLAALSQTENQRLAVVADVDIVNSSFLQNAQENVSLAVNLVDWMSADPMLSTIPSRTSGRQVFTFVSPQQAQLVQYTNLFLPPLLVALVGVVWLRRRARLARRVPAENQFS